MDHEQIGHLHLQPERANRCTDRMIISEHIGEGFKSADAFQRAAPKRDGGTHARMCQAAREADQCRGQEMKIDPQRHQSRPDPLDTGPPIETGDRADIGSRQRCRHFGEIVRPDGDIAVAQDQDVMPRVKLGIGEIGHLGICPQHAIVEDKIDSRFRICGAQILVDGDGWIIRPLNPADHLQRRRPILCQKAGEVLLEVRLRAVERLQKRDGLRMMHRRRILAKSSHQHGRPAEQSTACQRCENKQIADDHDGYFVFSVFCSGNLP